MLYVFTIILAFLTSAEGVEDSLNSPKKTTEFYREGLQYVEAGDWVEGLKIWLQARNEMVKEQKSDPRIGTDFIELVTEKRAYDYYNTASQMYFWGFSGRNIDDYKEELIKEAGRVKPLITESEYDKFYDLAKKGHLDFGKKIRGLWFKLDPTPSTQANERLMEHWERINFARKNFKKNSSTVYGTDDRGIIYVQYGAPDVTRKGILSYNPIKADNWAGELERYFGVTGPAIDVDIGQSETGEGSEAVQQAQGRRMQRHKVAIIKEYARQYHQYSDYEVWVYKDITTDYDENLLFIFGNTAGAGKFGLASSLDDFISQKAFRKKYFSIDGAPFSPGPLLQILAYDQLRGVDKYFYRAFSELESNWNSRNVITDQFYSLNAKDKFEDQLKNIQGSVEPTKSKYDDVLPSFDLDIQQFRFLDQENKPYTVIVANSKPHNVIIKNYAISSQSNIDPDYRIRQSMIIADENWSELFREQDQPALQFEKKWGQDFLPSQSQFILRNVEANNIMVTSELFDLNKPENTQLEEGYIVPKEFLGVSSQIIDLEEELESSENNLQASDLVLGQKLKGIDYSDSKIPFFIPQEKSFSKDDIINLYFEVYNLKTPEGEPASYKVEYQIRALNLFKKPVRKNADLGITLRMDSERSFSSNNLEIDLSEYTPGDYQLSLSITDLHTNQTVERKAKLEIK